MKFEKPIVFLDIESTGLDTVNDRIIQLGLRCVYKFPDPAGDSFVQKFHPGRPIPEESTAIHGITDEDVRDCPPFKDWAKSVHGYLKGSDLAGYNLRHFDIPILWEELFRAGIDWDLSGTRVYDAGVIFKKKEPRDLAAALAFYAGRAHDDAHDALVDCNATFEVLLGQLGKYEDLREMSPEELSDFSDHEKRLDVAGKIVLNDQGVPVFGFGPKRGTPVVEDPGLARWMLGKDFSTDTKRVVRRILEGNRT